jgi:hypothetical protein
MEVQYVILQYYFVPFYNDFLKLKEMINNVANRLRSHHWSKNQGKKDMTIREKTIEDLTRMMSRIDEWMSVPEIDGLPDVVIAQTNDEEVYYKNKPVPGDSGGISGPEQRSARKRDEREWDSD